ncbi:MAG: SPOR domain-containing protein [Spirochaetaceae bacterium]|nr:SPOR domain-containing protein [Spirochaetaceae bacterium]
MGRFRLQVGIFADEPSAQGMVLRLRNVGLNPAYEISNNYYRVVIAGVPATDLDTITRRINAAGFTDILIRTEP